MYRLQYTWSTKYTNGTADTMKTGTTDVPIYIYQYLPYLSTAENAPSTFSVINKTSYRVYIFHFRKRAVYFIGTFDLCFSSPSRHLAKDQFLVKSITIHEIIFRLFQSSYIWELRDAFDHELSLCTVCCKVSRGQPLSTTLAKKYRQAHCWSSFSCTLALFISYSNLQSTQHAFS